MSQVPDICKHAPHKEIHRFDDAWMGSIRKGSYESERTYEPIVCRHCGTKIRANKELTEWVVND